MTNISVPEQEPLPQHINRNDISSRQSDSSRYWTFLFDNLKRSIEQIYQTCESDQNPLHCQVINFIDFFFFSSIFTFRK